MTRLATTVFVIAAAGLQAQETNIQNGRIERRPATTVTGAVTSLARGADPVWLAWRVPMVDGDRTPCSTWSDGASVVRGDRLESNGSRPAAVPSTRSDTMRLDAGTTVTVLARVVDSAVERLRVVGDDCPIDATGQSVYWLDGVTPVESVRFLETLTQPSALNLTTARRLAESALSVLAYHRDNAATTVLDRLTGPGIDDALRRQAATALARTRGAYGYDRVSSLIAAERTARTRQAFVTSLAESPQPAATDALLTLARRDPDASVRAEAGYRYIRRAGAPGIPTARGLIQSDTDDRVRQRVVSGIASLPSAVGTPVLIDLARTTSSLAVRKEAVSALGRQSDPQAAAYLEELIGRP